MSKRLVYKLAVMVATLSAVTLLQGCGDEENSLPFSYVWAPVGFVPMFSTGTAAGQNSGGGGGQASAGATGGVSAAGAARAGGGGNQVGGTVGGL